jgi:hypothetical protein
MSKSGLSCYNGPVSTLCCAKRKDSGRNMGRAKKSEVPFFCPAHLSATQDLDHARRRIVTLPPFCLAGPSMAGRAIPCAPSPAGRVSTTEGSATRLRGVPALPEIPVAERYSSSVLDALHARQNRQKCAFASILGHWASTVYSGVQGSPRQSHHLFPLVQPWLCLPALPTRCLPYRGLLHVTAGWQPALRPVGCNPAGSLFRQKIKVN